MPENRRTTALKPRVILSVPVTPEQRAELEQCAGRQPLSAYVRDKLFPANDNDPASEPQKRVGMSLKRTAALACILAQLGAA